MSLLDSPLFVFALCCALAWFVVWPLIKAALPDSFPAEHPYSNPEPYDPVSAQRGGFSPYYPGGHRR